MLVLIEKYSNLVEFPFDNEDELERMAREFKAEGYMTGTVGVIDGTFIETWQKSVPNKRAMFSGYKGFGINLTVIVDAYQLFRFHFSFSTCPPIDMLP